MRILALLMLFLCVSCYEDDEDVAKYLRDFGFSSGGDDGVADQTSFKGSLVKFQEYYNLPVDGTLNVATLKLMRTPRCDNEDATSAICEC
ncbi:hypothetical protein Trydic_g22618 [Trypoxylus dichotomus]